jgi:hypothetical protein
MEQVFISFKSADKEAARKVYEFLIARGVPVFFSPESLPEKGNADYSREIDLALDKAHHLILVTSSAENAQSSWVEAEWRLFLNEKRSGRKAGNLIILAVGNVQPSDLPPSLRQFEVIPFGAEALHRVLKYVQKDLPAPPSGPLPDSEQTTPPRQEAKACRRGHFSWVDGDGQARCPGLASLADQNLGQGVEEFFSVRVEGPIWETLKNRLGGLSEKAGLERELTDALATLPCAAQTAVLLLAGCFDQAAGGADEWLKSHLSRESLRLALLANLAHACHTAQKVPPGARAAMCLVVLKHSPGLRSQWHCSAPDAPTELWDRILESGERMVRNLAAQASGSDEEWTGGLTLGDFLPAEDAGAQLLAGLGGRPVETPAGAVAMSYGYLFAKKFGSRWRLEGRALELEPVRTSAAFSPLFAYSYLQEQGRHLEILDRPPPWFRTPGRRLHEPSVRLVLQSALQLLTEGLKVGKLQRSEQECRKALHALEMIKTTCQPIADLGQVVARALEHAAARAEADRPTPWEADQLSAWYRRAQEILGDEVQAACARLAEALGDRQARPVVSSPDPSAAPARNGQEADYLQALAKFRHDQGPFSRAEFLLDVGARAAEVMRVQGPEAVCFLLESLVGEFPEVAEFRSLPSSLAQAWMDRFEPAALDRLMAGVIPRPHADLDDDYTRAVEDYRRQASVDHRVSLVGAVRARAGVVMRQSGPEAVAAYLNSLQQQFPDMAELRTMPATLARLWQGQFDNEAVSRLVQASLAPGGHRASTASGSQPATTGGVFPDEDDSARRRLENYQRLYGREEAPDE